MSKISLDVPLLAQELSDCCWHTSAMMIWMYWQAQTGRQGPMDTLTPTYVRNSGISPQEFITLAGRVGLRALPIKNLHASADLFAYLTNRGPIWCAGHWFGPGHIIVLTGVNDAEVQFNDPDGGVEKRGTVDWFNKKLSSSLRGCLMYKDSNRY
jgi:hypothetical protein